LKTDGIQSYWLIVAKQEGYYSVTPVFLFFHGLSF
jgi:hypothetical protein